MTNLLLRFISRMALSVGLVGLTAEAVAETNGRVNNAAATCFGVCVIAGAFGIEALK